jgi:hypothetical protein
VRAWDRFVAPAARALPRPYDPLFALDALAPIDAQTIAERIASWVSARRSTTSSRPSSRRSRTATSTSRGRQRAALARALGFTLELTQETGGVFTFGAGTRGLIDAMALQAPFAQWLSTGGLVGRVRDGVGCIPATATSCAHAPVC